MKKLYFLLFTILLSATSFGQTTVFSESFESGNSGVPSITCNDGSGDFFTRTDGSDISSAYEVSGQDGSFFFAAQDIDATECGNGTDVQTLLFDDIDISTFSNLTLALLLAEDAPSDGNFDWDGGDLFYVEVDYDNSGSFTKILQFATTASSGFNVSIPSQDTNLDGIGDGVELSPVFGEFTVSLGTGSVVDIRLVFDGLGAGDEDISVDNIRVVDGFVASPTVTVTAPSDSEVFAPGTTNVNLEFNTANTGPGDSVTVTVNGDVTNNATSPFSIPTTDGSTYNVTVDLVNGGVLDSDMISFSVGSLISVVDISALRADVTTNGLGRFYEITGGSLVTHTDSFRNRHWIEDSNISGILIYDDSDVINPAYSVGDLVSGLRGTTVESNGVLQFIPTSNAGTIDSSGNTVTPQVVTIANMNAAPDDYESEFVQLQNVTFVDGDGMATFTTGQNYNVTDGVNTIVKRTDFFSADYIGELIPSSELATLNAVAGEFNGTAQIYVRSLADFTLSNGEFNTSKFSLYPNPTSTGQVKINSVNSGAMDVEVYDILGKQVKRETITNTLDVSNLRSGVYILKITQNEATTTKKLVIR
ncbi:T9SS type A sorting domain-containing protein [Winogradskyella sp. A3E31]|uniref:T9SS type A sorting domain-containing protein n=1 Tax=Winogradskyella sp. A3E31 TaxID=3349637 RepID=UPI00398BA7B0